MAVRSPNINVMVSAAFKAARRLSRDFGEIENLQVSPKGTERFVATSREKASRVLGAELAKARPDYGMVMAGAAARGGKAEPRWIVDPINGAVNFAHGIPNFALTIAVQSGAEVMAGIVYDPLRDDLFWSDKGAGAYINDHRLRVSGRKDPATALVGTHGDGAESEDPLERALAGRTAGFRRMGCAALDLSAVAAGRLDGFWALSLKPWDMAAGVLLVREAGGYASAFMMRSRRRCGRPTDRVPCSTRVCSPRKPANPSWNHTGALP